MESSRVYVWDPLVRIVHWSLATLILVDLFNEAGANPWHRWLGYAAGALVVTRLAWGMAGSPHARLSAIAKSAGEVSKYVTRWRSGSHAPYPGHNPLGAWMSLALWFLTLSVVATGWLLQLERFWGDDLVEDVHTVTAYTLAAFIVLHVSGVLLTSLASRTNLIKAMITGKKAFPSPDR